MAASEASTTIRPSRILFASCNSQHYESVLWPSMTARNASAFVWNGDAVYADDFDFGSSANNKFIKPFTKPSVREATPRVIRDLYAELLQEPGYQTFRNQQPSLPILGAFDDHDYGINNGDTNYQFKAESAQLFMQFLRNSSSSANQNVDFTIMEQRAGRGEGVYGVKVFDFHRQQGHELLSDQEAALEPSMTKNGVVQQLSDRSVAIILVDCRTHKTPWVQGFPQKHFPDYEADFLGEKQWTWLEAVLNTSTATVNVVVQGLQVHADRYFDGNAVEDWSRFPSAQHRLYQAILKSGASAPVLVSGDVHMAELLRKDCRQHLTTTNPVPPRTLLEVTTSGMTHSWGTHTCARPHQSFLCRQGWFQKALTAGMHLAHVNHAWTDVVDVRGAPREGAKRRAQYALERNFGEFEFDWTKRQLVVRVFGEETHGAPLLSTVWDFDMLSGTSAIPENTKLGPLDFKKAYGKIAGHGTKEDDWICANYRGHPSLALKLFGVASPILLAIFLMMLPLILPCVLVVVVRRMTRRKVKKE